jgi:hypothetical protein
MGRFFFTKKHLVALLVGYWFPPDGPFLLLPLEAFSPPRLFGADFRCCENEAGRFDCVEEDPPDQVGVRAVVHLQAEAESGIGVFIF